jgi:hypothetical protein
MPDSETTLRQKLQVFEGIKELVSYLETHGLERIQLRDLRSAYRALDEMKVDGFDD